MSRKETSHVSLIENTKPDDIPRLGLQPSSLFRRGSRDDGSRSTGSRTPQTPEKDEQENEISPNTSADSVILDFIPATEVVCPICLLTTPLLIRPVAVPSSHGTEPVPSRSGTALTALSVLSGC